MENEVDKIIANAKDSTYIGQSKQVRQWLYEAYQRDIIGLNLTNCDYAEAIQRLSDALEV